MTPKRQLLAARKRIALDDLHNAALNGNSMMILRCAKRLKMASDALLDALLDEVNLYGKTDVVMQITASEDECEA